MIGPIVSCSDLDFFFKWQCKWQVTNLRMNHFNKFLKCLVARHLIWEHCQRKSNINLMAPKSFHILITLTVKTHTLSMNHFQAIDGVNKISIENESIPSLSAFHSRVWVPFNRHGNLRPLHFDSSTIAVTKFSWFNTTQRQHSFQHHAHSVTMFRLVSFACPLFTSLSKLIDSGVIRVSDLLAVVREYKSNSLRYEWMVKRSRDGSCEQINKKHTHTHNCQLTGFGLFCSHRRLFFFYLIWKLYLPKT